MNKITALLLFTMMILSQQALIDSTYDFSKFVLQFKKNYTPEEYVIRKQIFDSNYAAYLKQLSSGKDVTITSNMDYDRQTINNYYNSLINSEFSATINNYYNFLINSGFSATIYNYFNFMINSGFSYSQRTLKSTLNLFPTPKQFDWRALGRVSPVKNQNMNYCGSCWAFVSTAQYESALAIATNGIIYDLSQQYALECDTGSNGCSYGYFDKALSLFNQTGVPLQETYPYKGESSFYKSRGQPICNGTNNVKLNYKVEDILMYDANSIQQIQHDLVQHGPMGVGVYGSGIDFSNVGSSGLISCAYAPAVNHAVLLVGYNTSHWFVKNSWGTEWGHNGYGYILKTADCGLSRFVLQMRLSKPSDPVPSGAVLQTQTLTISMSDSAGDGWQGTIIALQQKNIVIATFGSQFLKNSTFGPIKLTIPGNQLTKVVVYQIGEFTNEVGFTIKNSKDQLVYERLPGTTFHSQIVFSSFCPLNQCQTVSKSKYYIALSSKCGDWGQNVLGVRQNGVILANLSLSNNKQSDIIEVELEKGKKTQIIVQIYGQKTDNIQIKIRSQTGAVIAQRLAGTTYGANQILLSWEPGRTNEGIVFTVGSSTVKSGEVITSEKTGINEQEKQGKNTGLLVSTIVLSITSAIFLMGFVISSLKLRKAKKSEENEQPHPNQSEDRIQKETI